MKTAGVPHVVLLSSLGADQVEGTGPIKGLHFAEEELKRAGTKLSSIRASFFQENLANNIDAGKNAGIFPSFAASADYAYPMVATKDIGALVAATLLAPPAKSENVDLVGPAYSNRQAAEKLGARLGKTLKIIDIPADQFAATLAQAGLPKPIADSFAEMYTAANVGKLAPVGDRLVQGNTPLDETIAKLLPG